MVCTKPNTIHIRYSLMRVGGFTWDLPLPSWKLPFQIFHNFIVTSFQKEFLFLQTSTKNQSKMVDWYLNKKLRCNVSIYTQFIFSNAFPLVWLDFDFKTKTAENTNSWNKLYMYIKFCLATFKPMCEVILVSKWKWLKTKSFWNQFV